MGALRIHQACWRHVNKELVCRVAKKKKKEQNVEVYEWRHMDNSNFAP